MGLRTLTVAQLLHVHAERELHVPWTVIAAPLGMTESMVRGAYRRAEANGTLAFELARAERGAVAPPSGARTVTSAAVVSPEVEQTTDASGGVTLRVKDLPRVRTVDEVIAAGGLDPAHWTVKSATLKSYEGFMKSPAGDPVVVPLTSAHVTLTPNLPARAALRAIDEMKAELQEFSPRYAPIRYSRVPSDQRYMLEVCLFDVHLGMLAWAAEAGADYDVKIATDMLADVVDRLIAKALGGFTFDRILIPLGNDWLHTDQTIDGKGGATTRGTPQDVDTRWPRLLRMARQAAIRAIDTLRQIAPVTVIVKPGNHDSERMFHIGEMLDIWYRHDDAVTVINEPAPRTYFRYGATLLGFTHGHREKQSDLPLIMANEAKSDWAETTHHEWHIGHLHRKGEAVPVAEYSQCRVRTMPSLAPADAWHAEKGYSHVRAAEAYIWSFEQGYAGHLSENAELAPPSLGDGAAAKGKRRRAA